MLLRRLSSSQVLTRIKVSEILALSKALIKIGALQFGTFQLPSGKYTSFYIDLSNIPSFPSVFETCIELLRKRSKSLHFDAICGIPFKGLPIASVLSFTLRKPLLYIRKESIISNSRFVEGTLRTGSTVLLVDDVVSSGNTLLEAAEKVRDEGYRVSDSLVLLDRVEGAKELLRNSGLILNSVADVLQVARVLVKYEVISKDKYRAILSEKKTV